MRIRSTMAHILQYGLQTSTRLVIDVLAATVFPHHISHVACLFDIQIHPLPP